jgi:2-phospho-L-lactate/phosphoenolpyruvate guanylyltransferase
MGMGLNAFVQWIALVPVKAGGTAKSRLAGNLDRSALAAAMAQDTGAALRASERITEVVVVADGAIEASWADTVLPGPNAGLNQAVTAGAQWLASNHDVPFGIAVVLGDLPCLTGEAVDRILGFRDENAVRIVGDAAGTGTTMLLVRDGTCIPDLVTPRFGPHSCAAHVEDGALNLTVQSEITARDKAALLRARRDVDTDVDLWDAVRIGVGPATRAALMGD